MSEPSPDPAQSHVCRGGPRCRGPVWTESGVRVPATTIDPRSLCPSCVREVEVAVGALWRDYLDLQAAVGDTSIRPTASGRSSGTPVPQVPINVWAEALSGEIADAVHRAAVAISDVNLVAAPAQDQLGKSLDLVEANLGTLRHAPPRDTMVWDKAGEDGVLTSLDGVDLMLKMVRLHQRAASALGITHGRDRMPVPCPRCEAPELGRWHGSDGVDCSACGGMWAEQDYRSLTLIMAEEFA